jgi:NAD(P)-dependent dehydrogenase (short-subunit alcohol dehydrogenase family)
MAPLILCELVLPSMVACGGGTIINITSGAGLRDPSGKPSEGGWGMGYGLSKGGMHRIAGMLAVELGDRGIVALNMKTGGIAIERNSRDQPAGWDIKKVAPPDVAGAAVAWMVTSPEARMQNGQTFVDHDICREHHLVPGWPS